MEHLKGKGALNERVCKWLLVDTGSWTYETTREGTSIGPMGISWPLSSFGGLMSKHANTEDAMAIRAWVLKCLPGQILSKRINSTPFCPKTTGCNRTCVRSQTPQLQDLEFLG
jgi:hypothetical protein